MRANFVSIQIGGIIEGFNLISSVDILLERLFETKKMAKVSVGSNYLIERVKLTAYDSIAENLLNKKIYIHEKDESLKYLIRTTLELQGYDIQDKIDYETINQPSIIIMDSEDDLSGLEVLRKIKTLQNFVNTKIIVTSTVYDKTAILKSGADLYLPKPYEISDLIRWIEYFLKNI